MKRTKNVFSILAIVFAALAAAAFIMLPMINTWLPAAEGEVFVSDLNSVIPVSGMLLGLLELFNFGTLTFDFTVYTLGDYVRLISLGALALFAILFIVWLIVSIIKKKPLEFIWWFIVLIAMVASCAVVICYIYFGFNLVEIEGVGSTYAKVDAIAGTTEGAYQLFSVSLGIVVALFTNQNYALFKVSPVLNIIIAVVFVVAALAVLFSFFGLLFQLIWTCKTKTEVTEEVSESYEVIEDIPNEKPTEEPVIEEPAPVLAEEAPAPVAVEKVEEPEEEISEEDNQPRLIRRILVHKSGKVIRVLNEHYYDVTTNIFVEPGFEDPIDPNETEQKHYEKLLAAKGGAEVIKPEPKKVAPVVAKVEEPAGVYERISFDKRIKSADKSLKNMFNELKSELLAYGVKSRVSSSGDTFRLHTKTYAKLTIAGKSIKMYLALDPKAYKNSTIPFQDASKKNLYKEIPFVFKVKSDLSFRRAKQLIADTMAKDGLVQEKVEKHDWIKEM